MAIDPRQLRPSELCQLLNSTPIGEVIGERQLRRHRTRAGLRIAASNDPQRVDLLRYVAWLVRQHHQTGLSKQPADYAAMKEAARARNAELSAIGRDIGDIPDVVDPKRKDRAREDFRFFCETYFPETFSLPWSDDHLKVIAKIETAVLRGGLFAMAMPRGSGKTTLAETACIWAMLTGAREFVCLIGSDAGHARSMLESIKVEFETNEHLLDDYPEAVYPIHALERIHNRAKGQLCNGKHTRIVWTADEIDTTCELKADETVLTTSPLGGAPILWKEEGTGEKWAVIELGRPSLGRITAVLGEGQLIPTEANRWRYPWVEARLDGDPGSETYLRYVPVPDGLSSQSPGGGEDPARMAINRFEAHHCDDSVPGTGFEGLLGVGPVCDLPGVLHNCPPARSLETRLAPIPIGVTVQLTCERDTKGNPVWIFEAMSCVEIADPADGDRKFNLLAAGGGG